MRLGLWSVSQSVSGGHKTDHKTSSCDRAYKFCDSLAGIEDFDVRFDVRVSCEIYLRFIRIHRPELCCEYRILDCYLSVVSVIYKSLLRLSLSF